MAVITGHMRDREVSQGEARVDLRGTGERDDARRSPQRCCSNVIRLKIHSASTFSLASSDDHHGPRHSERSSGLGLGGRTAILGRPEKLAIKTKAKGHPGQSPANGTSGPVPERLTKLGRRR